MTKKTTSQLTYILEHLMSRKEMVSIAESCTGGYLSYLLTVLPGSSNIFKQGFVTYTNASKMNTLHINKEDIDKLGAVSPEIAILMAVNVKEIAGSSFGIGVTGNAGPTISENSKQVGEVYISISSNVQTVCYCLQINGTRDQIRKKSAEQTIELFSSFVKGTQQ
jgi:nicotinamide-nucleotide amidase